MTEAILKLGESSDDGVCVISASGDIDAHTSPLFREIIEKTKNPTGEVEWIGLKKEEL